MSKLMLFICSLFLLFIAGNAFYIAFKKYEEDDDFSGGVSTYALIDLVLAVVILISEKFAPQKYHIVIFKTLSFLFGLMILGSIVLLWVL
jgi:formate-dependent nitrite reductase membrane component NrfD